MKIGIVDVGGAYRGIYTAGVFDRCLDDGVQFDLGIGVSVGSCNLISYAAGQVRRNYRFFTEYAQRREYISPLNYLKKGTLMDLDYAYSTLSNSDGEYPLDYEAFQRNPMEYYVVALNAETGETRYFDRSDVHQDDYNVMKASSALPVICKPYYVGQTPYFDGALGDCVPVQKALDLGCDKVVLLLTRPVEEIRTPDHDIRVAHLIRPEYPLAADRLCQRAQAYNQGVALAKQLQAQGRGLILAPDDTCGVSTRHHEVERLDRLYRKGYQDGARIKAFVIE